MFLDERRRGKVADFGTGRIAANLRGKKWDTPEPPPVPTEHEDAVDGSDHTAVAIADGSGSGRSEKTLSKGIVSLPPCIFVRATSHCFACKMDLRVAFIVTTGYTRCIRRFAARVVCTFACDIIFYHSHINMFF